MLKQNGFVTKIEPTNNTWRFKSQDKRVLTDFVTTDKRINAHLKKCQKLGVSVDIWMSYDGTLLSVRSIGLSYA